MTSPAYSKTEGDKGAVWKGRFAIVVRCDGSASVENVDSTTLILKRKGTGENYFSEKKSDTDPWLVGTTVYNPK